MEAGDYDESIGKLSTLSLVVRGSDQRHIIVHPLIHEWIHLRMESMMCAEWTSKVLMLLCSRLPPLLYSSSDKEAHHQADIVLCHLERVSDLVTLYYDELIDVAPECAIFFLEAYLWYRGARYLDIAVTISQHVAKQHKGWVQKLIHAAYLCRIIQDFQAQPMGDLDRDLYQHHLDKMTQSNRMPQPLQPSHRPPPDTRFVLTEAAIAFRLYETLDRDVHVEDRQRGGYDQSTTIVSKVTRAVLGSVPIYPEGAFMANSRGSSRIDKIGSAVLAYCGAKDYLLTSKTSKAYELLDSHREGAALGVCYGLSEMRLYFRKVLQAMASTSIDATTCLDTIHYIDELPEDMTLVANWNSLRTILVQHNGLPGIKRFVFALTTRPEFLRCEATQSMFKRPGDFGDWLEHRLNACRELLGHTSRITYETTFQLARHYTLVENDTAKAQSLCIQEFEDYKATGKLLVRDGYDPYWPESLFKQLTLLTAYDTEGTEALCRYMVSVFTGYDEGSYLDKNIWARRLDKVLQKGQHALSRKDLAQLMLNYLEKGHVDRYHWQYGIWPDLINDWGATLMDLSTQTEDAQSSQQQIKHQKMILAMYQVRRPYLASSNSTSFANKWATQLSDNYLLYEASQWKDFANKILLEFEEDLGLGDSICSEWRDRIYQQFRKLEGGSASRSASDAELDRVLSLPSHSIHDWTENHLRLWETDGSENTGRLKDALIYAGYEDAVTEERKLVARPERFTLPHTVHPRQCRLPFGLVVGKTTRVLLAL